MNRIILFLLAWIALAAGQEPQKVLHVSTIPGNADIYLNELNPDKANNPPHTSPAYIPITGENAQNNDILISLFRPEFRDTTIHVTLSAKDTSFLIVSLKPTYDDILLDEQQRILAKRSRRNVGHVLMYSSIAPFVAGAASCLYTLYEIQRAEDTKSAIEKTVIGDEESFNKKKSDFNDYRDNAKVGKTVTLTGLVAGASLLAIGFALSF